MMSSNNMRQDNNRFLIYKGKLLEKRKLLLNKSQVNRVEFVVHIVIVNINFILIYYKVRCK